MTKETEQESSEGRIDEFIQNRSPLVNFILMILGVLLVLSPVGLGMMAAEMASAEYSEVRTEYDENSVEIHYESGEILNDDNLTLLVDGDAVDYDLPTEVSLDPTPKFSPGDTINYTHGGEWDGEEVRLVWEHDTPEEVVLYEGTAPEKSE